NGKQVKITKPKDAMENGIGYLPEDRKLDGIVADLSVRENIILALQVMRGFFKPFSKAEAEEFADKYIKLLGIKTASRDTPIKSLSGGNQQKAILARWLLTNPQYLILDEPFANVDILMVDEMLNIIKDLQYNGSSVIISSHNLYEIESIADSVLLIDSGLIKLRESLTLLKNENQGNTLKSIILELLKES
ncbi:MAG TPA: ATP-binding cassette domain-containing protein, partial [Candidatus Cloacimonadota bacterium]|nr:ATP-binding cassette domain-containing protein [Candidatus Cloacimonadota bacterium]